MSYANGIVTFGLPVLNQGESAYKEFGNITSQLYFKLSGLSESLSCRINSKEWPLIKSSLRISKGFH